MKSPFVNDIFSLIWSAFKELYPDKECTCYMTGSIRPGEDGTPVYGVTEFADDGAIDVWVDINIPATGVAEVLEHELAHVAVGVDAGHGEEWEKAFDLIHSRYEELATELNEKLLKEGEEDA